MMKDKYIEALEAEQRIMSDRMKRLNERHSEAVANGEEVWAEAIRSDLALAAGEFMGIERALIIYKRVNQDAAN